MRVQTQAGSARCTCFSVSKCQLQAAFARSAFLSRGALVWPKEELVAARGLCDRAASCQHSVLDTEVLLLQNVVAVLS